MMRKTLQGLGLVSAVCCVSACNTVEKTAEGHQASKLRSDESAATGASKDTTPAPPAAAQPSPQTVTVSGDRPAVATAAVSAAIQGGGSATAAFLGTWTTTAESHLSNCAGNAAVNELVGTSITWTAGTAGHIQAELIGKCVLDAKVYGNTATASDQTCNDNGISYAVAGTFVLQPDGTARLNEHVRATGRGLNCTGTMNGPYQKYTP
jgi:hypothetical protein